VSDRDDKPQKLLVLPVKPKRVVPADLKLVQGHDAESRCEHHQAMVDAHARTVRCVNCKVAIDPIRRLDDIARDASWVARMRLEKAALDREIEELRNQRATLKAAVRRAKGRT
jgi:hypothetical protein